MSGVGRGKLPAVQVQLVCEAFKWLQSEQRFEIVFSKHAFLNIFLDDVVHIKTTKPSKSVSKSLTLSKGQPKKKATGTDYKSSLTYCTKSLKQQQAPPSVAAAAAAAAAAALPHFTLFQLKSRPVKRKEKVFFSLLFLHFEIF